MTQPWTVDQVRATQANQNCRSPRSHLVRCSDAVGTVVPPAAASFTDCDGLRRQTPLTCTAVLLSGVLRGLVSAQLANRTDEEAEPPGHGCFVNLTGSDGVTRTYGNIRPLESTRLQAP
jgi:hypothetical protein